MALLVALHVLAAVVWVGGMFFAYMVLRPAAGPLETAERLARDERRRGKLVPGQLADLVVLDRDLLACGPDELAEVRVVATMLGGAWTHNPPPWS